MSGIYVMAVQAKATLYCNKCSRRWSSKVYVPTRFGDEVPMIADALALGWRVYAAARGQRTYCPDCGPSKPMYLLYGTNRPGWDE